MKNILAVKYQFYQRRFLIFALLVLGAVFSLSSQENPKKNTDVPIGLVVYCSVPTQTQPEKAEKNWERIVTLWYKSYKQKNMQEGGGALLIASAPELPANSPEIERLKNTLGFDIVFTGISPKKNPDPKADSKSKVKPSSKKKKTKKSKKQTSKEKAKKPLQNDATVSEPKVETPENTTSEPKKTDDAVDSSDKQLDSKTKKSKKTKPTSKGKKSKRTKMKPKQKQQVLIPSALTSIVEGGLRFIFYSPNSISKDSNIIIAENWLEEFKNSLFKLYKPSEFHFLLLHDPSSKVSENPNPVADGIRTVHSNLLENTPSVVLLNQPRDLRFFEGEYSFGCGLNRNKFEISVLELFFRNGKMIRIREESYNLNNIDSNRSWILE
ncbi:LIC11612 family fibronectin-binding protein [Leptospira perolatii]|uniref:LIC11612 family fibronectin-binding protein n=1 Tax=Leptospira perolatii TaxID=2023191 RepID=UPI000F633732|nr:hypothetical protein [Leptospira perolatii]